MSNERTVELYDAQWNFVTCKDRFTAFVAGIGSGKTHAGAIKAMYTSSKLHGLGLVVAPTYVMLRDATLRTLYEVAGDALGELHKSEMRSEVRGGGEILFRSAEKPDRLRGPNISWAWIDEGALCPTQTWDIVIGRLREGGRAGPCWVTSTPKGRNWLYHRAEQMTVFGAKTADNPYLDREFVASLQQAYTGAFARQELEGEFVTFEGVVYEEFNRNFHMAERGGLWKTVIAGVDEGYTNPAVILAVGIDSDGRMHVIDEFYKRRVLQGDVVAEARRFREKYDVKMFYVDPSAAGLIAEMKSERLPVVGANHDVNDGIQAVKAMLAEQGDGHVSLTIDPSCVNTAAEFESYAWKEGREGLKDEPEKINDHAMDALRYAVMASYGMKSRRIVAW